MDDALVTIGDFSRMSHLTVKALRYYHDVGILVPWDVDPASGYRRYHASQVASAQVVRRLRDLDMPVDVVKEVIAAPDVARRNEIISAHLTRMEEELTRTRTTVASLRRLLAPPVAEVGSVEYRSVVAQPALAIDETVELAGSCVWLHEAIADIAAAVVASGRHQAGPSGVLIYGDIFAQGRGRAVAFVPVESTVDVAPVDGRVVTFETPEVELAVLEHRGPHADIDRTYGKLGAFVAERAIGVSGPIWENFLVTVDDVDDDSELRTEVCWPVFRTGALEL